MNDRINWSVLLSFVACVLSAIGIIGGIWYFVVQVIVHVARHGVR